MRVPEIEAVKVWYGLVSFVERLRILVAVAVCSDLVGVLLLLELLHRFLHLLCEHLD